LKYHSCKAVFDALSLFITQAFIIINAVFWMQDVVLYAQIIELET